MAVNVPIFRVALTRRMSEAFRPLATLERQKDAPKLPKTGPEGFSAMRSLSYDQVRKTAGMGNNPEGLAKAMFTLERQEAERQGVMDRYEKEKGGIVSEGAEKKDELLTDKARDSLYAELSIDRDISKNSWAKQFLKGLVDGAIVGNMEFVESVAKDPKKALETIKSLLSIEGLKKALEAVGKSLSDLFSWNPYDTGKSLGELGIVATGAGIALWVARKGIRGAMKTWIRENVIRNAWLVPEARIAKAEEILGRGLNETERKALLTAHETGNGSVYAYPKTEIRQKAEILRDAWFKKQERRDMMESGLTGKPKAAPEHRGSVNEYINSTPQVVADVIRGEKNIITDPKLNLTELTKELRWAEGRYMIEQIEWVANAWVEARLRNVNNFLDFVEHCQEWLPEKELLNGKVEIRRRTVELLTNTAKHSEKIAEETWLAITPLNKQMIESAKERIKAMPRYEPPLPPNK